MAAVRTEHQFATRRHQWHLCWVYLVIFLVRIIPNVGFDRLYKFQKEREDQRFAAASAVTNVKNERDRASDAALNLRKDKLADDDAMQEQTFRFQ